MKAEAMTDHELLRDYVERGVEASFQNLVQRHVRLVYGTAFRQLNDSLLAEEVSQNVFMTLAQKAIFLGGGDLAGWLYKVALLKTRERYREEQRRKRRETLAIELSTTMKEAPSHSMSAVLDEALLELKEKDRQALLLRFIEEKSLREVGQALGVSDDTAQKRVSKALETLAQAFRRRGYAVPAASLAAVLYESAQAVPAGLAQIISEAVLAKGGTASATGLSFYLLKLMSLTKPQTVAICLALSATPILYQWNAGQELTAQASSLQAQLAQIQAQLAAGLNTTDANAAQPAAARLGPKAGNPPQFPGGGNPFIWSEDSPFVQVPKSLLSKISIPAIGDDARLTDEMARALELTDAQLREVNDSLESFHARYTEMELGHYKSTDQHSQSIHISNLAEQKSFIRDAFTDDYGPLLAQLKDSLSQTIGNAASEYFWKNTQKHSAFSEDAARVKRVTLMRIDKEEPGGGPYFLGEEFLGDGGSWNSSRLMKMDSESAVNLPFLRETIMAWRKGGAQ